MSIIIEPTIYSNIVCEKIIAKYPIIFGVTDLKLSYISRYRLYLVDVISYTHILNEWNISKLNIVA